MKYTLKKKIEKPFFRSKNSIIIEVNNEFISFTGYSRNELIGKSLAEIGSMLRIDSQVYLENIRNQQCYHMFTKEYDVREFSITCRTLEAENEKIYFFKEKVNSCIEHKFPVINKFLLDNQIGIGIYSAPDLTLLKANQYYLDLLGKPYDKKEKALGRKVSNFVYLWENTKQKEVFMNIINTGQSFYGKEIKEVMQNWEKYYLDVYMIPIIEKGEVKYIVSVIENVTERVLLRKSKEEQTKIIKEQKEKLEVIINNMSDGVFVINKDYDYCLLNSSAKKLIYNLGSIKNVRDSFLNTRYYDIQGNLLQLEDLPISKVLKGEKIKGFGVISDRPDGVYHLSVSGSPFYDTKGNISSVILIVRDVTDWVIYAEDLVLKNQLDLLNNIIQNLNIGFVRFSYPEFKIIDINNKGYSDLKQFNPKVGTLSSIKGNSYFDVFGIEGKDKAAEIIENLIENKSDSYFIYRKIIAKGEEKYLKCMYQSLLGLNSQVVEIIVIIMDVTDEVKAKNKMEKALKVQDEIFSNISHELKTPLNVIYSTNQLMELYLKNDSFDSNREKVAKCISVVKQNCYRFIKLINNIVDMSKIDSGYYRVSLSNENIVNITENIVQSVSDYVKRKGLNIIFDTNTEEKIIACDPIKIERIILNLISNAIKFTNAGGSIFVNLIDKYDTVEISVEDTGIGMSKKDLDNIFKRFHQVDKSLSRNSEGSGIGLTLVKSIVELHGGKISAESTLDKGSMFKIELPVRSVENSKDDREIKPMKSKIEMINIEFSDIYSIE